MDTDLTMTTAETEDSSQGKALSLAVIRLLKGVIYQDDDPGLWQKIINLQPRIRDYVAVMGLTFQIDESEGYAWLATLEEDEDATPLPRLMNRRQLSYPVSLLIALLRRKLAEADTTGGELRLILDREEVVNLMRTFLPGSSNEARTDAGTVAGFCGKRHPRRVPASEPGGAQLGHL